MMKINDREKYLLSYIDQLRKCRKSTFLCWYLQQIYNNIWYLIRYLIITLHISRFLEYINLNFLDSSICSIFLTTWRNIIVQLIHMDCHIRYKTVNSCANISGTMPSTRQRQVSHRQPVWCHSLFAIFFRHSIWERPEYAFEYKPHETFSAFMNKSKTNRSYTMLYLVFAYKNYQFTKQKNILYKYISKLNKSF